MERRRFLAVGALAGGAAALGLNSGDAAASSRSRLKHGMGRTAPYDGPAPPVTAFTKPMPIPPVLRPQVIDGVDTYRMTVKPMNVELFPGLSTPVLTYCGHFPGPTIRAQTGRPAQVVYTDGLNDPITVHLHGGETPAADDGYPTDFIQPGDRRVYRYPNGQQGTTLWYHDHAHMLAAEHVYRGLHGFYLLDDPSEAYLRLPTGANDVPIMLRDGQFDDTGALVWGGDPANRTTILANGTIQPYFPVAARKYRFRLLNAANERVLRLNLADGVTLTQIGSDGGLLPAPVPLTELVLCSAERADIVVDFSAYKPGTRLVLSDATTGPVLRFDVVGYAPDDSRVPDRLRPLPVLPAATATRDVTLSWDLSGSMPVGLINGKTFDPARVDFTIKRGTTEIWNVINGDPPGMDHSFHVHQVQFQVLDRNGAPPGPEDAGRKDTINLPSGETVRIKATFGPYTGLYLFHCHFMEHSELGMMAQMNIV